MRRKPMWVIRLKPCLIAIGGLVMLIAAVARLNALDADAPKPAWPRGRRRSRALQPSPSGDGTLPV